MLKSEYKEEFLIAEGIELETVQKQDTVTFVKEDKTKHKLKTRMIYDVKSDENGNVLKFKARLVALGYDQRRNEYEERYAPVARITSIMILLVIGWMNSMDIRLLDFKGAYLHAKRPENTPVYLAPIPGIETPDGKMNFLNKGLYGTFGCWKSMASRGGEAIEETRIQSNEKRSVHIHQEGKERINNVYSHMGGRFADSKQ